MKIEAQAVGGSHRTGTLTGFTPEEISNVLGFTPNVADDPDKVVNSWGFNVDGHDCGIWDYKGSHMFNLFSTYGPDHVFKELFGKNYS